MLPEELKIEAIANYGRKFAFIYPVKEFTEYDILSSSDEGTGKATGEYYAQCSVCGGKFESSKPGNNPGYSPTDVFPDRQFLYCPHCGARLEPRKGWYGRKGLKDRFYLQAWEVHDEQHVTLHECIIALDDFSIGDWKRETVYDLRRTELTPGRSETYRFSPEHGDKLLKVPRTASPNEACGCTITGTFRAMTRRDCYMGTEKLENTFLRYCLRMLKEDDSIEPADFAAYIIRINAEPMLEMLFKMGYTGIVKERVSSSPAANGTRHMMFNVRSPKKMFRGLSQNHAEEKMKQMIRLIDSPGNVTTADLEDAAALFRSRKNVRPEDIARLIGTNTFRNISKVYELLPDFPESRINRYITENARDARYYLDYLEAAANAGAPLNEQRAAFPADLHGAHDEAVRKCSYKSDSKTVRKCRARHKQLTEAGYEYQWHGIITVIPDTPSDIIAEGKILRHCVGSYVEEHAQGQTNIIFIRRTGSTASWFTLEVDPETLEFRQCYGYKNQSTGIENNNMCKNHEPIVGEFLKHYKRRLAWAKEHKKEMKMLCRKTA